mgnify:CR=1 FL=1
MNPITLAVIWGALQSIAVEIGTTVHKTAYSEQAREGQDFSVAVFDPQGRMVAQGPYSPGHMGAMSAAVKDLFMARRESEEVQARLARATPGSIFIVPKEAADTNVLNQALTVNGQRMTIVGVVADIKHDGLASSAEPEVFVPYFQFALSEMQVVVATTQPAERRTAGGRVGGAQEGDAHEHPALRADARASSCDMLTVASIIRSTIKSPNAAAKITNRRSPVCRQNRRKKSEIVRQAMLIAPERKAFNISGYDCASKIRP